MRSEGQEGREGNRRNVSRNCGNYLMQGLGLGSGCEPSLGALPWGQGCASPCPRGPDKEPPSHSAKAGLHGGGDYAGQGGRQRGRSDSGQTPGSLGSVSLLMKSFSSVLSHLEQS